jgi:hypothetical protein
MSAVFSNNRRLAETAAKLVRRTGRAFSSPALQNLSTWATENGIFDLDDDVPEDFLPPLEENEEAEQVVQVKPAPKMVIPETNVPEIDLKITRETLANNSDVNWRDPKDWYRTKLHKRVFDRDLREIRRLLDEAGANPHVRDADGWTPARTAMNEGYWEIAQCLTDAMKTSLPPHNAAYKTA